jgi:hypothetical protein
VIAFNLPPIPGLGTGAGFEFQLVDRQGRPRTSLAARRAACLRGEWRPAALRRLHHLLGRHAAALPRHRPRAALCARRHSGLADVFAALQPVLGSAYVNDFNLFGRSWQVRMSALPEDRGFGRGHRPHPRPQPLRARWCRSAPSPAWSTRWARPRSSATTTARSTTISGDPGPGVASGTALSRWRRWRRPRLPPGFAYQWTGTALQEKEAAGQTGIILALAVLFAFLFLVALYESWTIPVPVLLSVTVGVFGAMLALLIARAFPSTSMPRSARGADRARGEERILIVEFAKAPRGGAPDRRGRVRPALMRALPGGDDDELRLHRRPDPAGDREGASSCPAAASVPPWPAACSRPPLVGIFVIPRSTSSSRPYRQADPDATRRRPSQLHARPCVDGPPEIRAVPPEIDARHEVGLEIGAASRDLDRVDDARSGPYRTARCHGKPVADLERTECAGGVAPKVKLLSDGIIAEDDRTGGDGEARNRLPRRQTPRVAVVGPHVEQTKSRNDHGPDRLGHQAPLSASRSGC